MEREKTTTVALGQETKKIVLSLSLTFLAFLLPFLLGHPQIVVGTFVNTLLFLASLYLPFSFSFPLSLMPSLSALARGILFGPKTFFLYYLLPFIWLGNLALIISFSRFYKEQRRPFFLAGFLAASFKTLVLYFPTLILVKGKVVPPLFLSTMGFFQFLTASFGCLLAYFLFRQIKKFI